MNIEDEMRWSSEYRNREDNAERLPSLPITLMSSMMEGIKMSRSPQEVAGIIAITAIAGTYNLISAVTETVEDVMADIKTAVGR